MIANSGRFFRWRSVVGAALLASFLLLLGCRAKEAATEPPNVSAYTGTWQYRWGDSPRLPDGALAWTTAADSPEWQALSEMGSPPDRGGKTSVWVRTRLTGQNAIEPTLYLRGVDQIFEAYVDGALVYHFGTFDGPDARRFLGYKAHYIPLGQTYQGKTLTLRIYSDHVNIGIFGEPLIGSHADVSTLVTRRDLPTLAMGSVMGSIGAFVFLLFLARRKERGYLTYGLLALTLGMYFTAVSPSRQLILDAPLVWVHAELFFLYIVGGLLTGYVEYVFGRGWRGIVRWIKFALFGYTVLAAILVATGFVPVLKTLLPYQILLLAAMFVLTIQALRGAWSGSPDARIFSAGFLTGASAGTYDVLGAMGILSRTNVPIGHLGIFAFTLALGLILARRFLEVQERLGQYSTVLGLSLASARVLEPGKQAQIALDELLRLLKGKRAFLFLTTKTEGSDQPGELELRAMRDVSVLAQGSTEREVSRSFEGLSLRMDVLERVRVTQKPLITSTQTGKKRRSAMAAPLLVRNELVGVVYLEAAESRRPFDDADLAVLLGLGTQLSITIVTTRAVRLEVQSALQKGRIERQSALLEAASRMAKGDVETPIVVDSDSDLADLGRALDEMRCDVRAKIEMLQARNADIQVLNDELRRKIEERTMTLLMALMSDDAKPPPIMRKQGSMIGDRYRIERKLGEGAMGVVYDVERTTDGKHLAIKLLTEVKDKPSVARFIREANILARMDHPNLVSIFDVDVTPDGQLFIVMELFAGQTLEKYKNKDVPWSLSALAQIVEGLAAVHACGVVHRDLKPSNVLVALSSKGQPVVKLADFGISTLAGGDETQAAPNPGVGDDLYDEKTAILNKAKLGPPASFEVTKPGVLVGTPSYMAPELGRGGKVVRPSSDIFGFGIMAYELLAKERPFHMPPVLLVATGNPLTCPSGLRSVPGLSSGLVELLERCLSPEPEARPNAIEIAEALADEKENTIKAGTRRP